MQQDAEFGNMVDIVLREHDSEPEDIEIDPDILDTPYETPPSKEVTVIEELPAPSQIGDHSTAYKAGNSSPAPEEGKKVIVVIAIRSVAQRLGWLLKTPTLTMNQKLLLLKRSKRK